MQDPRAAELDEVTARVAAAAARDEPLTAVEATFLLRRYLEADAVHLQETVGLTLAHALVAAASDTGIASRAGWLALLVEATALSDDERILPAIERLVVELRGAWPARSRIAELAASVDACLRAAEVVHPHDLVQDALDRLEEAIGSTYRPGDGLVQDRDGLRRRCSPADHVRCASALLTAFELTGRLPYSMLAEELILVVVRTPTLEADVVVHSEAARVLCRIAWLHDDPGYRGAAVIAAGADYRAQASRMLAALSADARGGTTSTAAAYGLALHDLLRHVR